MHQFVKLTVGDRRHVLHIIVVIIFMQQLTKLFYTFYFIHNE